MTCLVTLLANRLDCSGRCLLRPSPLLWPLPAPLASIAYGPALQACLITPCPAPEAWLSCCLPCFSLVQAFSLTGGLINVLRIPERWLQPAEPGKAAPLDHLLNSHQVSAS